MSIQLSPEVSCKLANRNPGENYPGNPITVVHARTSTSQIRLELSRPIGPSSALISVRFVPMINKEVDGKNVFIAEMNFHFIPDHRLTSDERSVARRLFSVTTRFEESCETSRHSNFSIAQSFHFSPLAETGHRKRGRQIASSSSDMRMPVEELHSPANLVDRFSTSRNRLAHADFRIGREVISYAEESAQGRVVSFSDLKIGAEYRSRRNSAPQQLLPDLQKDQLTYGESRIPWDLVFSNPDQRFTNATHSNQEQRNRYSRVAITWRDNADREELQSAIEELFAKAVTASAGNAEHISWEKASIARRNGMRDWAKLLLEAEQGKGDLDAKIA